jgi:flagellar hook-associated protein 3 FlgL
MSAVGGATDVGTLSYVLYNMGQTQQSISTLTAETSSGYISSDYAGLGASAGSALDLTSQLAQNTTLQANTSTASNIQQVTQTALGQIQTLVSNISSQLLSPSTTNVTGLSSLAATANGALQQIATLLDTKVGNVYIFAGQDSSNPPVPDPQTVTSSAFYTAIQNAVAALPTTGAATLQSQSLTIAGPGATSPFSATLEASNQPATVDLGNGEQVQVGMLADQNTNAASIGVGVSSTGSYMRDIFMGLATLGSMGTADPQQTYVQSALTNVQNILNNADTALNEDIGGLGVRQDTITSTQTELSGVATALTTQLGNLQDSDPATVATQLAQAQTQLQSSYSIVAALGKLTLATYLT